MEFARSFVTNLSAGLRLATFCEVDPGSFRCNREQTLVLAALSLALAAIPALTAGAASSSGFRDAGVDVTVILVFGALLALLLDRPALRLRVPVMLLSLAPAGTLAAAVIRLGWASGGTNGTAASAWLIASAFYLAWALLVHYRALEVATKESPRIALPLYGLYLAIGLTAAFLAPHFPTAADIRVPTAVAEDCSAADCKIEREPF